MLHVLADVGLQKDKRVVVTAAASALQACIENLFATQFLIWQRALCNAARMSCVPRST